MKQHDPWIGTQMSPGVGFPKAAYTNFLQKEKSKIASSMSDRINSGCPGIAD